MSYDLQKLQLAVLFLLMSLVALIGLNTVEGWEQLVWWVVAATAFVGGVYAAYHSYVDSAVLEGETT